MFQGPTLAEAWDRAAAADVIKLDLKQTDRGFLNDLVAWLRQHKLLVLAWTVNDGQRFNELVRLGVNGITTANLAILRALG